MKRFIWFNILFLFLAFKLDAQIQDLDIHSDIAILINVDNQRILYQKNIDQITPPASLTKVATALFALKEAGGDLQIKIEADQDCVGSITSEMQKGMEYKHPAHWLVLGGTHMSIAKGDTLSLEELLYGLMLVSANDAANIIAKYVSGSIPQFMSDLNDYLEEIGCKHTVFRNPHGLHFPQHVTTATDMALIFNEALKYPKFCEIIQTSRYQRPSLAKSGNAWIANSNLLIRPENRFFCPFVTGGKTGVHNDAQMCLVESAHFQDRSLVLVLMRCSQADQAFEDAKLLFEKAFQEEMVNDLYLKRGAQPFRYQLKAVKKTLRAFLKEDVRVKYFPSEKPSVTGEIHWDCEPPIAKGDCVGQLKLKDEHGVLLKEVNLYAQNAISLKNSSKFWIYFLLVLGLAVVAILANYWVKSIPKGE